MSAQPEHTTDDRLTIIFISVLAYFVQDVLHEGLGHGVTAFLSGAHHLTLSTVALSSDIETRWIAANGTLVNLLFGVFFWLLLRKPRSYRPATRYFFILAMAGNLFTGAGYFLFSGVTNFGDWAEVIQGLHPHWLWQFGLVALGVPAYAVSVWLVAVALKPFDLAGQPPHRIRLLSWTPYVTEGVLAGVAGLLNPAGLFYVIASALPSTLGANAGMWMLPGLIRRRVSPTDEEVAPVSRSIAWIASGAIATLFFIFVLGRGVTWAR